MKRVDDQALADFQDEANQKDSRRQDKKVFRGKVSAVSGSGSKISVQVTKTGEAVPSPHAHLVTSTWDPKIGDQTDIYWRDEQSAIAVPVGAEALARMPARHPYMCRLYWTGSYSMPVGWTLIPYNNSSYDYSSMRSSGDVLIPVTGVYLATMRAGTTLGSSNDITTGIWWRPAGGASIQVSQGSRTQNAFPSNGNASVCTDIFQLTTGDRLNGYCWNQVSGAALESGGLVNYMAVCLLSR